MKELDKILDKSERVFWEGAPKFWPFIIGGTILTLVFGMFWMFFLIPFGGFLGYGILFLPHFWIGLVLVAGIPLYTFLVYKHVYYAITNKRVIIQKGLIGRDFEMIDFDQITNAEVNVGIFDKLFGGNSGSILISTAGSLTYTRQGAVSKPYTLRNIENPYEVFKFFKKISHDVKTDIHYPNKYRPRINPGYKTSYKARKK